VCVDIFALNVRDTKLYELINSVLMIEMFMIYRIISIYHLLI